MHKAVPMRAVAKAFIISNNKILLLQRSYDDTSRPGEYDLPGGGVESGESLEEGLIREIIEETGLVIKAHKLVKIVVPGLVSNVRGTSKHVFFAPLFSDDVPVVTLSQEHIAYQWLTIDEIQHLFEHPFYSVGLRYAYKHNQIPLK